MDFNFENAGFGNIIVKEEDGLTIIRTNVYNEEEFKRWKDVFSAKNKQNFNVKFKSEGDKLILHKVLSCIHGDKRQRGIKKTYTG